MNRRQRRFRSRIKKLVMLCPPAVAALLWLVGLLLPPTHREVTHLWLPSTPDAIWAVLTDLDGMPNWREDLTGLERLPSGAGTVRWREIGAGGSVAFERVEAVAPWRLVVRLAGPVAGSRQWTYRITAASRGAELAVVEESRIDNPFRRCLVGIFGADRGRLRRLNRDLARRLNVRHEFAIQAGR